MRFRHNALRREGEAPAEPEVKLGRSLALPTTRVGREGEAPAEPEAGLE